MIVKLALAALISGIAIPAVAIHHFTRIDAQAANLIPDAGATMSAMGRSGLGPFLSGLI